MQKQISTKITCIFTAVLLLALTACEHREVSPIIGKWEMVNWETKDYNNPQWQQIDDYNICRFNDTEEYWEDGDWTFTHKYNSNCYYGASKTEGEWLLYGNQLRHKSNRYSSGTWNTSTVLTLTDEMLIYTYPANLSSGLENKLTLRKIER